MIPWLRSKFSVYVFEASLVATLLALLVSIVTNTTIVFKLCLVTQGLFAVLGLAVQGVQETIEDARERRFLDAFITGWWYAILLGIGLTFEYFYIQILRGTSSTSPGLGRLVVLLIGLFTSFILLVTALGLTRAVVTELRAGWAHRRIVATIKSTLFSVGIFLCLWAVYYLFNLILFSR